MVKHISRQGVASVCLMSLNWCKTPRGRPETSLSGSGRRTKIQRKTIRRLNKTAYQRAREEWKKIKYNEKLKKIKEKLINLIKKINLSHKIASN